MFLIEPKALVYLLFLSQPFFCHFSALFFFSCLLSFFLLFFNSFFNFFFFFIIKHVKFYRLLFKNKRFISSNCEFLGFSPDCSSIFLSLYVLKTRWNLLRTSQVENSSLSWTINLRIHIWIDILKYVLKLTGVIL